MKEQLGAHPMHAVPTLVRYVALAVGFGVVAMILEWRRRSEWAAAFYLFFPAPFALLMTLLARRGGVEWFGAADDWREESIGLWLMANGLVYLGLALWSGRARSNYVRFWGDLLMWIVPVSLLVPPDLLCRKGIELVKIGGEWFTSYELASLVLSVGLVVLGTRMRRYSMALSGLGGMAAFIVIVTLLHFPHDLLWPLSLTAVGGAAMAAAVLFIVIRARQRPYATM
ncbi:MAG: hypothetical protein IMZ65_04320 [Planctomycetes bacterium]|nr:hypothetical protein [Planctomycetota bacterium]